MAPQQPQQQFVALQIPAEDVQLLVNTLASLPIATGMRLFQTVMQQLQGGPSAKASVPGGGAEEGGPPAALPAKQ